MTWPSDDIEKALHPRFPRRGSHPFLAFALFALCLTCPTFAYASWTSDDVKGLLGLGAIAMGFLLVLLWAASIAEAERKRVAELPEFAQEFGFQYVEGPEYEIPHEFSFLPHLDDGIRVRAENIIYGQFEDYWFIAFDYLYETMHKDKDGKIYFRTTSFGVFVFELDFPCYPLTISSEASRGFLERLFDSDDIDFESVEFNRRFYVRSSDRKWAYDIIHPRMMEFLLEYYRDWMGTIMFSGNQIRIINTNRLRCATEYKSLLYFTLGIVQLIPNYVRQQQLALLEDSASDG